MPFTLEMSRATTIAELKQAISKAIDKAEEIERPPDLSGFTRVDGYTGQDCAVQVYPDGTLNVRPYSMCDYA